MSLALPWLAPLTERLQAARRLGRFPPALLIQDQPGAGGNWLADFAARTALCESEQAPCGECRSCQRFASNQHPDLLRVGLEEDSRQIRIEQIRELTAGLVLTSHGHGVTVAILTPADAMNTHAANALLKTLEEPRAGVSLILVTQVPSRLPATIRSRCQKLVVRRPTLTEALAWLRQERGAGDWEAILEVLGPAPLAAAEQDPAAFTRLRRESWEALRDLRGPQPPAIPPLAERWAKAPDLPLRLLCLENWLTLLLDAHCGSRAAAAKLPTGAHLQGGASVINMASLFQHLERLHDIRRLQGTPVNMALALEQLLWQWRRGPDQPRGLG
ncbi:MAG: hypothetical protein QM718_02220 [Steroidobacteraceae bacterium]